MDIRTNYEKEVGEVWGYSTPKKRRNFRVVYLIVTVIFWALIITLFIWR
jgi:hypothetical protein